ncbi:MAG: iron-sulfur cluster assembly scaffold protein [Malacoplasma sp.]|nr:iron-sulfur cluster assembly scaffold protein [Malacoplasma sp.]MDE5841544.1 iron-sulfur cluster assembly scaffold protein [Malacoplasma sp.]MDE7112027.1 iron-sulfur cluster assembly scaffold protein [Malacoplasma sp.]
MAYFSEDESKSRQLILDHYEIPDNKIREDQVSKLVSNYQSFNNKSESCIDNLTIYLLIENEIVLDAKFSGIGCAISTASTDIFCSMIKNKNIKFINELIKKYFQMIEGNAFDENELQYLIVFKNISKQLNRIKCAKVGVVAIEKLLTK